MGRQETEENGSKHSPKVNCSWILRDCNFHFLLFFPSLYQLCHIFKGFISHQ